MPPYPVLNEDLDVLRDIVRTRSLDIVENKRTTQRLLDERKALKCMLKAYAKAGLEEQVNNTQTKLKDNLKFLNLIAEDQRHNKEDHAEFSAELCQRTRLNREEA